MVEGTVQATRLWLLAGLAAVVLIVAASAIGADALYDPIHQTGQASEGIVINVTGPPDEVQRLLDMTYMI